MRVLYIHQYFATPHGKTGTRSYEFARRWVQAGHSVQMLTTTAQLTADDLKSAEGRFFRRFFVEGIDVLAVSVPYRQQMGIWKRCVAFTAFVTVAVWFVVSIRKYDIIYATSTPLTVGIPALFAKWLRRKKFVFEVRDQWPQIPIEMGIIRNKVIIRMLLGLERMIYKSASAIVALSPGMEAGIRTVIGDSKEIATIPNSSDTSVFHPGIDDMDIRKKHGWEKKFVLLHFGAMGRANGLGFVINTAQKLKDQNSIHFVIVGGGSTKDELKKKAKSLELTNIEFIGAVCKKLMPQYVAACDVSIVIFANYLILEHNSANKFFDSLSAGKPVLLNHSGWQREVIESNNAGFGCKQCDVDEFIEKICYLHEHPDELLKMGYNARKIAEEKFDRDLLAHQALHIMEKIVTKQSDQII